MNSKLEHVRTAKQSRYHICHWPNCNKQVPPAMWGCPQHWFKLPVNLRNKVWKTYRVGQEEDLNVSPEYLEVAQEIQQWIKTMHGEFK